MLRKNDGGHHEAVSVSRRRSCRRRSGRYRIDGVREVRTMRKDLRKADISTLPDEVQEVIRHHEGLGRELAKLEQAKIDESEDTWYYITYFEPLIKGEASPFDTFWFATVSYSTWPEWSVSTHYYSLDRYEMAELTHYEPKKVPEMVEGVA